MMINEGESESPNVDAVPSTSSAAVRQPVGWETPCNTPGKDGRLHSSKKKTGVNSKTTTTVHHEIYKELNLASGSTINHSEQSEKESINKKSKNIDDHHKNTNVIGTGRSHAGGGIKNTFHGVSYQMKLPMLYIVRALKQNCKFQLATEVIEADKLDDLLFLYGDNEIGFFQAKHKLNEDSKITEVQLLSKEGDFSISKYFQSYNNILLDKKELKNDLKNRDLIVVMNTNIGIDSNILENFRNISVSSKLSRNKILALGTDTERANYYIIERTSNLYGTLVDLLQKSEPPTRVAENLAKAVVNNKKKSIKVDECFERYREWLLANILEFGKDVIKTQNRYFVTFRDNFLSGSAESILSFWNIFSKTYLANKQTGKEDTTSVKQDLSGVKFTIPNSFGLTSKKIKKVSTTHNEEDVRKYLNGVVFAVKQLNETKLGVIIEKEIGDYMRDIDRNSITCKFQAYIQNWAKQQDGRFLTREDIECQFAVWGQESLNQFRMNGVKNFGCTFEESNEVIVKLSNFLTTDNDANVLCLYGGETLFSKIKVCQVLESFASQNIDQNFIFCDIKDLIELEKTNKCPVKAFSSQTCNTLFVSLEACKLSNDEIEILRRLLQIIIKSNSNAEQSLLNNQRKRLIMTIPKEKKSEFNKKNCFSNFDIESLSVDDLNNRFGELDEKSRRQLMLKGRIKLHGNYITGLQLENELALFIRDKTLLKFISSELEINDAFPVTNQYNEEVHDYYVNRSLVPVNVSYAITDDTRFHFVREYKDTRPIENKNQEVVVISSNKQLFDQFRKTNINVHWLKETHSAYLMWVTSQGTVINLRKYVRAQDPSREPENVIPVTNVSDLENDLVLISADPGMGKSILLSRIAEQSKENDSTCFVVKTNLASNSEHLYSLKREENVTLKQAILFVFITTQIEPPKTEESESAFNLLRVQEDGSVAFLPNARFDHLDHLRAMVFCSLYNKEKIVLLLDGFDEIAPDYCKTTLNLLQTLRHSKLRKMWVTTRPYDITKDLENVLETFAYTLNPLSEQDQLKFFEKFWEQKIPSRHTGNLSSMKNFLNSLNMSTFSAIHKIEKKENPNKSSLNFMSVPLHSYMVAKVLTKDFIKFCSQDYNDAPAFTPFTIFDLYSNFFNIKFDEILYKENLKDPKNRLLRKEKKIAETNHGMLGLLELFDEKLLTELVPVEDRIKLLNSITSGNEKTGIVAEVVDNKPRFVHRTFAEYFAAQYLAKNLISPVKIERKEAAKSLLYNSVTCNSEYYYVLFTFFNYKVISKSQNKDIFEAALSGNIHKVSENENVNEMFDPLNRTPMHLVAMYYYSNFFDFEYRYNELDLTKALTMYTNDLNFIQRLEQSIINRSADTLFKWTPTHYFTVGPFACIYINYSLLSQHLYDVTQDALGRTPLMLLILNHSTVQYFKGGPPFNLTGVNTQDHFLKTALHYALKNFTNRICSDKWKRQSQSIYPLLNDLQIICFLLKHGARIDIPDNQGITPVDMINSVVTKETKKMFKEFSKSQEYNINKRDYDDIYLTSLNYITEHLQKHGYNVFSFEDDEVNTPDNMGQTAVYPVKQNVYNAERNFICKRLPCLQYMVGRRKRCLNSKIKPVLIYTMLRQLLYECDAPPLPTSLSNVFTFFILNETNFPNNNPELCIKITDLIMSTDNDDHKSIILNLMIHKEMATFFITKYPHLADEVDSKGRTALHYAVKKQNSESVTSLMQNNARVDIPDNKSKLPAHVKKLNILNGGDTVDKNTFYFLNELPREITSPLVLTMNLYPILTQIDADFIVYALHKTDTIAHVLLSLYPDAVNTKDFKGRTALHYAVENKNYSAVCNLIDNNAQADIADNDGKYPAHLEKYNQGDEEIKKTYDARNRKMLRFINSLPFDVAKTLVLTMALIPPLTPSDHVLLNSYLDEHPTIASTLWSEYSDLLGANSLKETSIYFDSTKVSIEIMCILLVRYFIEDFSDNAVKSNEMLKVVMELHNSVKNNDLSRVVTVLRSVEYSAVRPNLANVNLMSNKVGVSSYVLHAKSKDGGKTALHYAAEIGNAEIAQCLLSHGARYEKPDIHGSTPIQIAKTHGNSDVLHLLETVENLFNCFYRKSYDLSESVVLNKEIDGNLFHCRRSIKTKSLIYLVLKQNNLRLLRLFVECYKFKADIFNYMNIIQAERVYSALDEMNLNETKLSDAHLKKILKLFN